MAFAQRSILAKEPCWCKGEIVTLMLKAAPQCERFTIEPIPAQEEFLANKYSNRSKIPSNNGATSKEAVQEVFN